MEQRCPVCGKPATDGEARCLNCQTAVRDNADPAPHLEVSWVAQPPTRRGPTSRQLIYLGASSLVLVLGVLVGVIVTHNRTAAGAGAPASTNQPAPGGTPSGSAVTGAPSSGSTLPPSPVDQLPRSTAIPVSLFVVPVGGSGDQRLYVADVGGSVREKLRTPSGHHVNSPTLSVDRRSLIYIDRTSNALRTIAVDGSGDRLLAARVTGCVSITHVTWNPADQSVLVVRCVGRHEVSKLFVCDLTGHVVREISPSHLRFDDPTFSPDGSLLAYWASDRQKGRGGGSIYVAATDGSTVERQLTRPGGAADADPAWSPDGSQLAFTRAVSARNANIYRIPAQGGKVRPVMTGPAVDEKPAWSPTGTQLLTVSNRTASGKPGKRLSLYLISLPGRKLDRLGITAADLSTPVWSRR